MYGLLAVVVLLASLGLALAQPAAPPPCQVQLAQALQRSIALQTLAAQERDALATYFQEEIRKVTADRDALQHRLDELKPQAATEP